MDARKFALTFGIATLVVGLASLIPALVGSTDGLPMLALNTSYGRFLELFTLNVMNKGALISMGVFGIMAALDKTNAHGRSVEYSRTVCMITAAMGILGLIPATNTLFGYWPLFGTYNVFASLSFAVMSGLAGYVQTAPARTISTPLTSR